MADVQISQPTSSGSSGGASWAWALIVIVLLAVIGWFVFGGGLHKTSTTKIDINAPAASAPAGGSSGGSAAPPSGGTKTP